MRLGSDEGPRSGELLPARMLNEFVYCPRLFYLEWVESEFVQSVETVEGQIIHRRVDVDAKELPGGGEEKPFEVRSVELSSAKLGLSGKIDLIEGENNEVQPVDYKRGRPPRTPERAYEPERVQLCAYGLLLREHGYRCERGVLYFAQARVRIDVEFDEALVTATLSHLANAKTTALEARAPPPLRGSPKCQGCSLHGICLPDELTSLTAESSMADGQKAPIRRLVPSIDDSKPLYVQEQGARIGLSGETTRVHDRDGNLIGEARLFEVSHVVLIGNVQVSSQAIRELHARQIPICWLTYGGWFSGTTDGLGHNNLEIRRTQFRAADDPVCSLKLAQRFVRNKIINSRTLLRRNHPEPPARVLHQLSQLATDATRASSPADLLGIEGNAARMYFEVFPGLLRPPSDDFGAFDFSTRSRRPPKDPTNALLSLAYALLAKDITIALRMVGLDPFLGFYHQPRFGRPALALDVMEEFRSIISDSVVLSVINMGILRSSDFIRTGLGVALKPEARIKFFRAYERRMEEEVTHPVFGYKISYRRVLEVQCRLLARCLLGEIPEYPEFRTR